MINNISHATHPSSCLPRLRAAITAVSLLAAAVACPATAQAAHRYIRYASAVPVSSVVFPQQELQYINAYRAQMGQPPLVLAARLNVVAQAHSQEMQASNTMSHAGFSERFQQSGFTHCVENVGWNYTTPGSLFAAWRASPHHNVNMLNPSIRYAGISIVGPFSTFFACN
jgi:uncharacterized protein YkwD